MESNKKYPGTGLIYYTLNDGDELAVRVGWDEDLGCHEWRRVVVHKVTPKQAAVVVKHPVLGRTMEMRYLREIVVGSRIPFWPERMNWSGCATYLMSDKFDRICDEYEFKRLEKKLSFDKYFPLQRKRFFVSAVPGSDQKMRDLMFKAESLRQLDNAFPGILNGFYDPPSRKVFKDGLK